MLRKVLIVDDEFLVRLGLKTTINWPQYGYNIVGEASNGLEALKLFDRLKPDVLMTDIKMPDMDGLELISEIKKKGKEIQIIIISNYRDFDYARQAIKFGVSQYLIKSEISQKSLLDTLNTLSFVNKPQPLAEPNNGQKEYIRSQLYNDVANSGSLTSSAFTVPPEGLFPESSYVILICSCDSSQLAANTVNILSNMLSSLIDLHFHNAFSYVTQIQNKIISMMIAPVSYAKTDIKELLLNQSRMLSRNIKQYSNIDLNIGLSLPGDSPRFPDMFVEAETAKQDCFFLSDTVSMYGGGADASLDMQQKISIETIREFVDKGDVKGLDQYITDIFSQLKKAKNFKYFKNCYIDFLAFAKSIYKRSGRDKDSAFTKNFDYESLNRISSISIAEKYVHNLYSQILNLLQNRSCGYSYFIKVCLSFIESHYSSSITLTDAAKAVNISSSYLSLVFKQETGINFSDYLMRFRIGKAKELLRTTNLRIYEIAEKVGFSSPYYFSKVFKDVTKLTCKEYKDKFIQISH